MKTLNLLALISSLTFSGSIFANECASLRFTHECVKPYGNNQCKVGNGAAQAWEGSPCEKLYEEGAGLDSSNLHQMACINMGGASYTAGEGCKWFTDDGTPVQFEEYIDYRVEEKIKARGNRLLSGSSKKAKECNDLGGIVVTVEEDKEICLFHSNACPYGWSQYKGFATAIDSTCEFSVDRGNAVGDDPWNECLGKIKQICGHDRPAKGQGHAWGDGSGGSQSYSTILRICRGGDCGDEICSTKGAGNVFLDCKYDGGGAQSRVCRPTPTQIGCI